MRASKGRGGGACPKRPQGFWDPFNRWWRAHLDETHRRPRAGEVEIWYLNSADGVWGDAKPTLEQTKLHSKSLRSVSDVRDYFRRYRARHRCEKANSTPSEEGTPRLDSGTQSGCSSPHAVSAHSSPLSCGAGASSRRACSPLSVQRHNFKPIDFPWLMQGHGHSVQQAQLAQCLLANAAALSAGGMPGALPRGMGPGVGLFEAPDGVTSTAPDGVMGELAERVRAIRGSLQTAYASIARVLAHPAVAEFAPAGQLAPCAAALRGALDRTIAAQSAQAAGVVGEATVGPEANPVSAEAAYQELVQMLQILLEGVLKRMTGCSATASDCQSFVQQLLAAPMAPRAGPPCGPPPAAAAANAKAGGPSAAGTGFQAGSRLGMNCDGGDASGMGQGTRRAASLDEGCLSGTIGRAFQDNAAAVARASHGAPSHSAMGINTHVSLSSILPMGAAPPLPGARETKQLGSAAADAACGTFQSPSSGAADAGCAFNLRSAGVDLPPSSDPAPGMALGAGGAADPTLPRGDEAADPCALFGGAVGRAADCARSIKAEPEAAKEGVGANGGLAARTALEGEKPFDPGAVLTTLDNAPLRARMLAQAATQDAPASALGGPPQRVAGAPQLPSHAAPRVLTGDAVPGALSKHRLPGSNSRSLDLPPASRPRVVGCSPMAAPGGFLGVDVPTASAQRPSGGRFSLDAATGAHDVLGPALRQERAMRGSNHDSVGSMSARGSLEGAPGRPGTGWVSCPKTATAAGTGDKNALLGSLGTVLEHGEGAMSEGQREAASEPQGAAGTPPQAWRSEPGRGAVLGGLPVLGNLLGGLALAGGSPPCPSANRGAQAASSFRAGSAPDDAFPSRAKGNEAMEWDAYVRQSSGRKLGMLPSPRGMLGEDGGPGAWGKRPSGDEFLPPLPDDFCAEGML